MLNLSLFKKKTWNAEKETNIDPLLTALEISYSILLFDKEQGFLSLIKAHT